MSDKTKQITIWMHPHLYAEEQLMDWMFDNTENGCILPIEEFAALWNHYDCKINYEYNEKTTLFDVVKTIVNVLIEDIYDDDDQRFFNHFLGCVFFMGEEERFFPENRSARFEPLLHKYFDPQRTGFVHVEILDNVDAGRVWEEDGLRYYMHSHEGNQHNEPHVHVRDFNNTTEASIALSDQRVLCGELSNKLLKKAKKKIAENQEYFFKCWSEKTDGLVPDINRHFKLIRY